MDFWHSLPKPFFVLAPMEDVTDAAFRRLIASYGKPHVFFTEFTSADGLVRADAKGQEKLRRKLLFSDTERPIVAQLFSSNPEYMEAAARMVAELGFDGLDINMGCPDRAVEAQGCGAALIKNPPLAREIIRAAKRGVAPRGIPVSVKTRIGYNKNELDTWLPEVLAEEPANVTIHARTRKEMSLVPARWEHVAEAVKIRDSLKSNACVVGNGDLQNVADAREKVSASGADGAMLGRAIYGNPWLFADANSPEQSRRVVTPDERIEALIEHIRLFDELLGDVVSFSTMKKHFKAYISGWDNAKDLRMQLMETHTAEEACAVLKAVQL